MLHRLRARVDEFLEAKARELFDAGHPPREPRLLPLYHRAADLFHQDRVNEVQRALAGATGEEETQARFLLEFLVRERAAAATAGERARLAAGRLGGVAVVGERRIPVRDLPAALAAAADPERRRAIGEARLAALDEHDDLREGVLEREREVVQELGYGSYVESCEVLSGIDLRALERDGERFLAETDPLLHDLLAWYLPRAAGVEPLEAREADAFRLRAAPPAPELFAGPSPRERIFPPLGASGLDLHAGGRLRVEARPELPGLGGARCRALRVPHEVVLEVAPRAGRPAHAALLEQLGRALHRAHTDPDLPLEFRWLGDASVPLAVGLTLEGLLAVRPWLARVHGVSRGELADSLRHTALLDLLRVRRAIALLQFALVLPEGLSRRERGERYSQLMARATGLEHDARGALASVGVGFPTARELRAQQLHALLAGHLRERLDDDWFRNPRLVPLLGGLLAGGQRFTAAELAVQLESQPLSFAPVAARLAELAG